MSGHLSGGWARPLLGSEGRGRMSCPRPFLLPPPLPPPQASLAPQTRMAAGGRGQGGVGVCSVPTAPAGPAFRPSSCCRCSGPPSGPRFPGPGRVSGALKCAGAREGGQEKHRSVLAPGKPFVWGRNCPPEVSFPTVGRTMPPGPAPPPAAPPVTREVGAGLKGQEGQCGGPAASRTRPGCCPGCPRGAGGTGPASTAPPGTAGGRGRPTAAG